MRSALWRFRTRPLEPIASPRPAIPSWAFGLVQSSMRSAGIAVMGSAIPVRRCLSARPSGLPIRPSWVDGLESAHAPLFEFRGPSGLSRSRLAACPQARGTSSGLSSPSAHAAIEVRLARALPRPAPSVHRVWLPSRRLAPSTALPAVFQTGSAHGVHPSERSPRPRLSCIPARSDPLAVTAARRLAEPKLDAATRPKTGFRGRPRTSPLRKGGCLAHRPPEAPMGFCPSQGIWTPALAGISARLLPRR
jgi:hypothetical protein